MNQKKSTKILIILIVVILITILLGGFVFAYLATDIFRSEKDLFFKYMTQIGDSENGFIDSQLKEYLEKRKNTPYSDEGEFLVNITSPTNQGEFENINNFNITYSGQVDEANSKAEQNISLNYSDEVNFPVSYKQIENTIGLQTKYVGSKYIAVDLENLGNMIGEDISLPEMGITALKKEKLTNEQKTYIKNTYIGILDNHLGEEKFSKVKESDLNGYKLTLTGEDIKNILVQLLETLKNDQSTIDIINEYLGIEEDSEKLETENIEDLVESINEEEFDEYDIEITVYSKNGQTSKIKISTSEVSFYIEKIKENNKLKILFYGESTEEPSLGRLATFTLGFEGLDSMNDVKEVYEYEFKYIEDTGLLGENGILVKSKEAERRSEIAQEKEEINLMCMEAKTKKITDTYTEGTTKEYKEYLEEVKINDNIKIKSLSNDKIQIEFADTEDIFVINEEGEIITLPEEKKEEEQNDNDVPEDAITFKYTLENNISFKDLVDIEGFTDNNSMILTDYEPEQVSNFLSAVGERLAQVNKQQMEELGLEEEENPIQYLIPSIGIYNMAINSMEETTMSEMDINTFNSKFENYEGTNQQAQTVKGLLSTISRNNEDAENDDMKITELNFNGQEYEATEENIASIKNNMSMEKNYRIEFEKDSDTGLIFRAVINER